jgi:MFS family permease
MIRDFKIAKEEKDIARYSGYLASSFAFCQFLFAVKWGKLADRVGRKLVLLAGLMGTSISLILFGFSQNFYMALAARSLSGCLNGNVAVLRTVVGEIATEKRHQPLAFSTLPLLFNFGAVVGPMIGGYFSTPKANNPYESSELVTFMSKLSEKFPYAMSNIVVAMFLWFSLICGTLFLEETHEVFKYRRDIGVDFGDYLLTKMGFSCPVRPWNRHTVPITSPTPESELEAVPLPQYASENTPLLVEEDTASIDSETSITSLNADNVLAAAVTTAIIKTYSKEEEEDIEEANAARINTPYKVDYSGAFTPRVIAVITGNFIISLHSVTYNEFLPVFLAGNFQRQKLDFPFKIGGGFGWNVDSIGTLLSSTGIMGILIILVIFPIIDSKLGTINGYRLSVMIFPVVYFMVPFAIFTLPQYNDYFPKWVTPIFLYTLTSCRTLASSTGMPQINILNHRAAARQHRTYVNSTTMSFLALARFTGPLFFGWVMSFGETYNIGWLTWWIMSLLALGGMVQLFWLEDYED